jgi:hypothetical protein
MGTVVRSDGTIPRSHALEERDAERSGHITRESGPIVVSHKTVKIPKGEHALGYLPVSPEALLRGIVRLESRGQHERGGVGRPFATRVRRGNRNLPDPFALSNHPGQFTPQEERNSGRLRNCGNQVRQGTARASEAAIRGHASPFPDVTTESRLPFHDGASHAERGEELPHSKARNTATHDHDVLD